MNRLKRACVRKPCRPAIHVAGAVAAALMVAAVTPAVAQSLVPIGAIAQVSTTVPNFNSFDISFVDPATHSYILGDRTQNAVDLFNTQTLQESWLVGKGSFTGATGNNDTSGPNGVMIVNSSEIWAGDGNSTVKIFSMAGIHPMIANISTGGTARADEMCYDPVHQIALVANDADNPPFITFFNVATHQIIKKINFDGKAGDGPNATDGIEQCQWDSRDQKFYLNIPEINGAGDNSSPGGVVYIDPATQTILNVFIVPLTSCSGPQGMAVGPAPQILLGCNGGPSQAANGFPTAIINDGSTGGVRGSVFATLLNEEGSDEVNYDAFSNTYQLAESAFNPPPPNGTASCGTPITAGPQHLGVVGAAKDNEGTSVVSGLYNCPTRVTGGNHSVASDPTTGHVFLPVSSISGANLCSQFGIADSSFGCIMVFQATGSSNAADIVWRDTGGDVVLWTMNGGTISSNVSVGNVAVNWSVVGKGDFNGDGSLDILWRDTSGNVAMWLMNDGTVTSTASLGNVPTNWSVVGTGDFNGDGVSDILWRSSNGDVAMWLMDGSSIASSQVVGNVPNNWSVAGSHRNSIVWHDASGNVAVWQMNGSAISSNAYVGNAPTTWSIAGAGDFNGDGITDILWRDGSGNVAIWLMDSNGQVASAAQVASVPTSWGIAQTGDFNLDGRSDLVWRDTSGNLALWMMNGDAVSASQFVGNIPTAWSIQAAGTN